MRFMHTILAASIALIATTAIAHAAPSHTIIGKDYESIGDEGEGSGTDHMTVRFLPNPSQSVIKITRVSCHAWSDGNVYVARISVAATQNGNSLKQKAIDISNNIASGNVNSFATINAETSMFLGVGRYPSVVVYSSGILQGLICSINGVLVP